uniref:Uncharacterized protein n=1 Tax=Zooxanthella nutricula TaxID=1333877 RepID=A0A7S2QCJ6_9DINO
MGRKTAYGIVGLGLLASVFSIIGLFFPLHTVSLSGFGLPGLHTRMEFYSVSVHVSGLVPNVMDWFREKLGKSFADEGKVGNGVYMLSTSAVTQTFCTSTMELGVGACPAMTSAKYVGMILLSVTILNASVVQLIGGYLVWSYATSVPDKRTRLLAMKAVATGAIAMGTTLICYSLFASMQLDGLGSIFRVLQSSQGGGFSSGQFVLYLAVVFQGSQTACMTLLQTSAEDRYEEWKLDHDEEEFLHEGGSPGGDYGTTRAAPAAPAAAGAVAFGLPPAGAAQVLQVGYGLQPQGVVLSPPVVTNTFTTTTTSYENGVPHTTEFTTVNGVPVQPGAHVVGAPCSVPQVPSPPAPGEFATAHF